MGWQSWFSGRSSAVRDWGSIRLVSFGLCWVRVQVRPRGSWRWKASWMNVCESAIPSGWGGFRIRSGSSGWSCRSIGPGGSVCGIELNEDAYIFARANVKRHNTVAGRAKHHNTVAGRATTSHRGGGASTATTSTTPLLPQMCVLNGDVREVMHDAHSL